MKTLLTKIEFATGKDSWPLIWQIIVLLLMIIPFHFSGSDLQRRRKGRANRVMKSERNKRFLVPGRINLQYNILKLYTL